MSIQGEPLVNKLILLFLFDKMEVPLTDNTLIEICTAQKNQWLNYMDFVETKDALLEDDFITNLSQNGSPIYSITATGRACLADFYTNIPHSVREEISNFVKQNKINYRVKQECVSDFFKNKDGSYTVVLKSLELQQPLFELKIKVPNKQFAKQIHLNWPKKAKSIMQNVYEILVE